MAVPVFEFVPGILTNVGIWNSYSQQFIVCSFGCLNYDQGFLGLICSDKRNKAFPIFYTILECEMSVQINVGLLCTKFIMMATIRKRPDQAFQH